MKQLPLGHYYVFGLTDKPMFFDNIDKAVERVQEVITVLEDWGIKVNRGSTETAVGRVIARFEYADERCGSDLQVIVIVEV